ncbi:hypothetical protein IG193_08545 [Infirmifilum lucidum]|uniref:Uncharacterized protein n=1 Tax=Infirmifilum lucidum TaxID=2776706 RepID=A0A7L9FGM6_9CREN|nr:hypothetical protein [Infirmifilum lucidum]QOJ78781.1 hypothetical protein IG193_08545 [Infirmifilum lucidum]
MEPWGFPSIWRSATEPGRIRVPRRHAALLRRVYLWMLRRRRPYVDLLELKLSDRQLEVLERYLEAYMSGFRWAYPLAGGRLAVLAPYFLPGNGAVEAVLSFVGLKKWRSFLNYSTWKACLDGPWFAGDYWAFALMKAWGLNTDVAAEGSGWGAYWFRYRNTYVGLEWREFKCNRSCGLDVAFKCVEFRIVSASRKAVSGPGARG